MCLHAPCGRKQKENNIFHPLQVFFAISTAATVLFSLLPRHIIFGSVHITNIQEFFESF
jgi:hypothetical protein